MSEYLPLETRLEVLRLAQRTDIDETKRAYMAYVKLLAQMDIDDDPKAPGAIEG